MPTKKKEIRAKTAKKTVKKPEAPKVVKPKPHERTLTAAGWKRKLKKQKENEK